MSSVRWFSRKCRSPNASQPYGPAQLVTRIALPLFFRRNFEHRELYKVVITTIVYRSEYWTATKQRKHIWWGEMRFLRITAGCTRFGHIKNQISKEQLNLCDILMHLCPTQLPFPGPFGLVYWELDLLSCYSFQNHAPSVRSTPHHPFSENCLPSGTLTAHFLFLLSIYCREMQHNV